MPKFNTRADKGMAGGCLSGLVIGGLLSGNVFGAMLGGMLGTGIGTFIGEYYDKKLESRKEALMKYKLGDNEKKLIVEEDFTRPRNVVIGSTIHTNVRYTILAPVDIKKIEITETRMLFNERDGAIKLAERKVLRTQGTYSSTFQFTIPEKISKGDALIVTIISNNIQTKTITTHIKIV
jgi:hypothetical protein